MDGRGTLFALVAARRQKVFKRGIDTYAKHVCRRRRDGSQNFPLFVLFVLFGQAKRTLKEKHHKVTFSFSYFCMTKSTKSHQRERSPLFENSSRVHESVARAVRGECVRQRANGVSRRFCRSPRLHPYHACEQSARGSRADSCTHCLHARYKCRAGVDLVSALTRLSK